MSNKLTNSEGFTLVELSIVIVIIALIIAGVSAGSGLVKQYRIRSTISDFYKFDSMLNAFKLQYNALPGDMKNSSSYWGSAVDGDGNGYFNNSTENDEAWNHLKYAGLLTMPLSSQGRPGSSIQSNTQYLFYKHGALYSSYGSKNTINIIKTNPWDSPVYAVNGKALDTKIDDEIPNRGRIMAFNNFSACVLQTDGVTNANSGYLTPATYNLSPTALCTLVYVFGR